MSAAGVRAIVNLPLRLGFVLARTDVPLPGRPWIRYRGVDRMPFVPTPEEEDELARAGHARLVALWHQYWDVLFTAELYRDTSIATDLRDQFAQFGVALEVIYAEVGVVQELEGGFSDASFREAWDRLRRHGDRAGLRPADAGLLGYDVSYPLPGFHSVLVQPGLLEQPNSPDLDVNDMGLLDDVAQVKRILPVANAMTSSWRPFCGIRVYSVP